MHPFSIHNTNTTLTWSKRKHNVRFGFDWRNMRENRNRFPTSTSPDLTFNSTFTRGPLDTAAAPQIGGASCGARWPQPS